MIYQIDVALKKVVSENATDKDVPEWEAIYEWIRWYEQEWKDALAFKRDLIGILEAAKSTVLST